MADRGAELLELIKGGEGEGTTQEEAKNHLRSLEEDAAIRLGIVNHQDDTGLSPLAAAACAGDLEMVKVLIDAGANPEIRDARLRTPFLLAVEHDHLNVALFLLTIPSSSSSSTMISPAQHQDCYKRTALHWACQSMNLPLVKALLLSTSTSSSFGSSPQAVLTTTCPAEAKKSLVNSKTTSGDTPIFWTLAGMEERAASSSSVGKTAAATADDDIEAIIKLLLQAGADPFVRNDMSQIPVDCITMSDNHHLRGEGEGIKAKVKKIIMEKMKETREADYDDDDEAEPPSSRQSTTASSSSSNQPVMMMGLGTPFPSSSSTLSTTNGNSGRPHGNGAGGLLAGIGVSKTTASTSSSGVGGDKKKLKIKLKPK